MHPILCSLGYTWQHFCIIFLSEKVCASCIRIHISLLSSPRNKFPAAVMKKYFAVKRGGRTRFRYR